jgi:hypothetical protein
MRANFVVFICKASGDDLLLQLTELVSGILAHHIQNHFETH